MMKELSMHIMDIVQNSIAACASKITIDIIENPKENIFKIVIADNGRGMSHSTLKEVKSSFFTSRKTRRVGLGIPLFDQTCQMCEGNLDIQSELGKGTIVTATMQYNHLDRPPLGDIKATIYTLIASNPDINFVYTHIFNDKTFTIDMSQIKTILGGVDITTPDVLNWIRDNIYEGIDKLYA